MGESAAGECRASARFRESPRACAFVVGTVCIGAFMGQLDASIVTLALPPHWRRPRRERGCGAVVSLALPGVL
jgi:hypothetical protein